MGLALAHRALQVGGPGPGGRAGRRPHPRPHSCAHAKHSRYSEETRAEALRLLSAGKPAREIARMLGRPGQRGRQALARAADRGDRMRLEATDMGGRRGATARRVEGLEFQNAMLREMLSDPKAGDPERLSNRRKAELGER